MDAGDVLGHCWCLRKVLAKSLSMPPLSYSPPASPDAALPDTPTPCDHDAPLLWRTDSTFFLVGGQALGPWGALVLLSFSGTSPSARLLLTACSCTRVSIRAQ